MKKVVETNILVEMFLYNRIVKYHLIVRQNFAIGSHDKGKDIYFDASIK